MISLIEERSMNAWPSLQTELYDGWVLRFANGYTKRANSICPLYSGSLPLNEKIQYCEAAYKNLQLPVIFKIVGENQELDETLAQRGYRFVDEVSVRVVSTKADTYVSKDVQIESDFSMDWLKDNFRLSGNSPGKSIETAVQMFKSIHAPTAYAAKRVDGEVVASGLGVMERGYMGIFDIVVNRDHRRMGYGRDIMAALLSHASCKHMTHAYLQVVVGNTPAETLYDSLGFQEAYRYWYRVLKLT